MKNILLSILLSFSLVSTCLTQTGCNTPQITRTYKSLAVTQASVDTARKAFLKAYEDGKVTPDIAAKALDASTKFNASYNAAIIMSKTSQSPTPDNVAEAAANFLTIVAAFVK